MTGKIVDIGRLVDNQKLGAFHVTLLVVSFLIMMTDGYDLSAAAFAGPALVHEFGLGRGALGPLFSAGLFAGLFGPPLFGFLADRIGRKRVIIAGAVFFGLFTWASVLVHSFQQLILLRFIAGLGLSGMLPIVVSLNSEFAPRRFRATMVVLIFCGVTLGGGLPGLVAAQYMGVYGWRLLFWIGGLLPIMIAGLLLFTLPESVRFLALRPARQRQLRHVLRRMAPGLHLPADAVFVIGGEDNKARFSPAALFAGRLATLTPLFWVINCASLMVLYFVNQWTPTLLSSAGVSMAHAAIATSLFQFGGTFGGLVLMRGLDRWGFVLVPILFAAAIPILLGVGVAGLGQAAIMALLFGAGFCLLGLQFGIIALEGPVFPTYIRSWGVGSCFAAGRIGSVIGPLVGGVLIAAQLPLQTLYLVTAIPLAIGAVVAAIVTPLYRRHVRGQALLAAQHVSVE